MVSSTKYSEFELVTKLQQQNVEAFGYLYSNYSTAIRTIITQIIKNEDNADDLLQQVFVIYWQKTKQYDAGKGRLFTWMLNIARNAAIDFLRSKANKNASKNVSFENIVSSSNLTVENNINTIGLEKYIAALKPEWKQVIQLSFFQGNTHEEMAEILNLPLGTVKTRLRSSLIELRKKMNINLHKSIN